MRVTRRFAISLVVMVGPVAFLAAYLQMYQESRARDDDFKRRAGGLAESLEPATEHLLERGDRQNLDRLVERIGDGPAVSGAAVFEARRSLLSITPAFSARVAAPSRPPRGALRARTHSTR